MMMVCHNAKRCLLEDIDSIETYLHSDLGVFLPKPTGVMVYTSYAGESIVWYHDFIVHLFRIQLYHAIAPFQCFGFCAVDDR